MSLEQIVDTYVFSPKRASVAESSANAAEFVLHVIPLGAAADYFSRGEIGEGMLSLGGDAAMLLTGGASKVLSATRAAKSLGVTQSGLRAAGMVTEGTIGGIRGLQGGVKLTKGEGGHGEIAEAILRLFGVKYRLSSQVDSVNRVARQSDVISCLSRAVAPRYGVSSFMQSGRVAGTRLTSAEFDALRTALRNDDVWLSVGKLDGNGNVVIKFRPNELGKAELHLPSNATHYEKLHELGHFEHWKSLGKNYDEWIKLSQVDRERWVLDCMRSNHWNSISSAERKNAIEQLLHALREAGDL